MRILPIMLVLAVFFAGPAGAQGSRSGQAIELAQGNGMTLSEAVESVRKQTDGRIISAETKSKNGNETHEIKVLTKDGKVKTFRIPGRKSERG